MNKNTFLAYYSPVFLAFFYLVFNECFIKMTFVWKVRFSHFWNFLSTLSKSIKRLPRGASFSACAVESCRCLGDLNTEVVV